MPLQATSGAASYDAFGGGAAAVPQYIEDVFSTYLYTGTGSSRNIVNNIDLSGKGGMVWVKARNAELSNYVFDTNRGSRNALRTNTTGAQLSDQGVGPFNADGFGLVSTYDVNNNDVTYASWTFRKKSKFFDVVTYSGNGDALTVSHQLGSAPGCIMIKRTNSTADWVVYHRSLSATYGADFPNYYVTLNSTAAEVRDDLVWNLTAPTATTFDVLGGYGGAVDVCEAGGTYVAYLFAHDAGGFGLTGTDNVISCGGFTTDGSSVATVNLGYEPQWILIKNIQTAGNNWFMWDTMRGWTTNGTLGDLYLIPNSSAAEGGGGDYGGPSATGFTIRSLQSSNKFIYIAIRRGPMKVPTDGTKVFAPQATQGPSSGSSSAINPNYTSNFPVDMFIRPYKPGGSSVFPMALDRLRGGTVRLMTSQADAEAASNFQFDSQTGVWYSGLGSSSDTPAWMFRRAPGFFDEVCYTGVGGVSSITHNLTVAPELIIVKSRNTTDEWFVWHSSFAYNQYIFLNRTDAMYTSPGGTEYFGTSAPVATATTFNVGANSGTNGTNNFVAYLFATCPGVSKVGTYTGDGGTQAIACGFTGGARFVLIKRTNTSGGWYVYDTARGMTTSTDPYLFLNSTAAESATLGSVTTTTGGFTLDASVLSAINNSGSSYIFLAIA